MNRSFPSPAREAFRVLVGLMMGAAAACTPNQGVKPGAPELIEFTIVTAVPGSSTATTVTPDTPDCKTGIASGDACLPNGRKADAADGGTLDADLPPDTVCRQASATTNNWCTCVADGMDENVGTWSCEPFANVSAVIAVFDRLLDTAPFDPGTAPMAGVMTTSATGGTPVVDVLAEYSATGNPNGLVFNLFGPMYFGNFHSDGPSLFGAPQPEFPSGATVMVSLQADKVHAKDGKTPYEGTGQLLGGTLVFTMAPFAFNLAGPAAMATDPATVMFTNFVDATMTIPLITAATSAGTPIPVTVTTMDNTTFTVTPTGGAWPAGSTVVISVDAATKNLLGQPISGSLTGMFTTP